MKNAKTIVTNAVTNAMKEAETVMAIVEVATKEGRKKVTNQVKIGIALNVKIIIIHSVKTVTAVKRLGQVQVVQALAAMKDTAVEMIEEVVMTTEVVMTAVEVVTVDVILTVLVDNEMVQITVMIGTVLNVKIVISHSVRNVTDVVLKEKVEHLALLVKEMTEAAEEMVDTETAEMAEEIISVDPITEVVVMKTAWTGIGNVLNAIIITSQEEMSVIDVAWLVQVVEEEIPDAAAVAATEAAAEEEILDAAAVAATEAAAEEEIPDAAAVAAIAAAAEEEILDAAAVAATVAVETVEEIPVAAAVAATEAAAEEEILDVAAIETVEEIPTMEDTVVVTEMCTKVVTVEEILAVAETEVETKIIAPIPIKVTERLNKIIERLLLQNRILLVPTRTQKVVTIVESQEVELTLLHILKRRDSWVEEGHSHVNNYATGQNIHVKVVVVEELLVSVTSMHKKMIESISL